MNSDLPSSASAETYPALRASRHFISPISWGAIFAGLFAALAMETLFVLFGAGLGFAIYQPLTDAHPVARLSEGGMIIDGISAVFSLWFGGWVAGRFTPVGARQTGWLHGFLVWAGVTVASALIISVGAGWAVGDLSKLVGGGLSLAGKPAAAAVSGASDLAKNATKQSSDTIGSFVDEAVSNRPADASKATTIRAKREIGLAVARLFNPLQESNMASNRTAVVKALTDDAGLSEPEADRVVTEWTNSYNQLKTDLTAAKDEAAAKARAAADEAAKTLAIFSLCAFVAFVLGGLAAGLGGHHGARFAFERDARADRPL